MNTSLLNQRRPALYQYLGTNLLLLVVVICARQCDFEDAGVTNAFTLGACRIELPQHYHVLANGALRESKAEHAACAAPLLNSLGSKGVFKCARLEDIRRLPGIGRVGAKRVMALRNLQSWTKIQRKAHLTDEQTATLKQYFTLILNPISCDS